MAARLRFACLVAGGCALGAPIDRLGEPAAPVHLDWSRAVYMRDGGPLGTGELTVPVVVSGRAGPVELRGWDLRVHTGDGRACAARARRLLAVGDGAVAELTVHASCVASGLPPTGIDRARSRLRYATDGPARRVDREEEVDLPG